MGVFKLIRYIESLKLVGNNVVVFWDVVCYIIGEMLNWLLLIKYFGNLEYV